MSNQSEAKVVPSGCHHRAGPDEMLLFFLNDTEVEVTLLSGKGYQTLLVSTSSKNIQTTALLSDSLIIKNDDKTAQILNIKKSHVSYFNQDDISDVYVNSITINIAGDYKDVFSVQGLKIILGGITYPIKEITFMKDKGVIVSPINC